jgi:hypothetical protein
MKQSLSDCPIYAAKVKLAGVTPLNEGGCWDAETNAKFISHVLNQKFSMECVGLAADIASVRLLDAEQIDLVTKLTRDNIVKSVAPAADGASGEKSHTAMTPASPTPLQSVRQRVAQSLGLPLRRASTAETVGGGARGTARSPESREDEKPHKCAQCIDAFKTAPELTRHVKYKTHKGTTVSLHPVRLCSSRVEQIKTASKADAFAARATYRKRRHQRQAPHEEWCPWKRQPQRGATTGTSSASTFGGLVDNYICKTNADVMDF